MQGNGCVRAQTPTVHPHWQTQHPGINDQDPYRSSGGRSLHFKGILTGCRMSIPLPACSPTEGFPTLSSRCTHGLCTHSGSSQPCSGTPAIPCGPGCSSQLPGARGTPPCARAVPCLQPLPPFPGEAVTTGHPLGVRACRAEPGSG